MILILSLSNIYFKFIGLLNLIIGIIEMKKLLLFFFVCILFVPPYFSQTADEYLVIIKLSQPQAHRISDVLKSNVYHQTENELLAVLNQNEIDLLKKSDVVYNKIEKYNPSEKYYLATRRHDNNDIANSIYAFGRTALVKSLSHQDLLSSETKYVPLKKIEKVIRKETTVNKSSSNVTDQLDDLINDVIEDINPDSVEYFIQSLQNFGTRFLLAPNRIEVAEWIKGEFKRFGIADVTLDSFYIYNTWQYNVIAAIPADIETDQVIVIGGHHDSITRSTPESYAPGADDNASGTTAVLETARVLMQNEINKRVNLKFVTFAAEEYGLYGSEDFAEKANVSEMKIKLMINHDMISYTSNPASSSKVTINYYSGSENYTQLANNCIDKYSVLTHGTNGSSNAAFSDSYSFWAEGFPAVYFEETEFSPYYHTNNDEIQNYNMEYCSEVIKASCATLISTMMTPSPINELNISDNDGNSVFLSWDEQTAADIVGYKIYIGTQSGNYNRTIETTDTGLIVDGLQESVEYYFGVSVVNDGGYESLIVEKQFMPVVFTMDEGVLVVDESRDGDGTRTNPTDEQLDQFYESIINAQHLTSIDISAASDLTIENFTKYSTIIWHGNDLYNVTTPIGLKEEFRRFLEAGGNLMLSIFLPSKAFMGSNSGDMEFEPGDFMYDYLKISKTEKRIGSRYIGSISMSAEYPTLMVDTTKTLLSMDYHISNVEAIYPTSDANEIYSFETWFDENSIQGSMKGKPIGLEYLGEDYKLILLTFPLYYNEYDAAKQFMKTVLTEKFDEPTDILIDDSEVPTQFSLSQNYPNPFNPSTTIDYALPFTSEVRLEIYDVLGQRVAFLVNETQSAGMKTVDWNASTFASGIYLMRMIADPAENGKEKFTSVKKLILVK